MANTLTVSRVVKTRDEKRVIYALALSGSYVQAVRGADTGEVLTLKSATNTPNIPGSLWGPEGPEFGEVIGGNIAGYPAKILPGASAGTWLLKLFSAAETELAAAGYPANVSGDTDVYVAFTGRSCD